MLQVMAKNIYKPEFQKNNSPFSIDETLHEQEESFYTIKKSTANKTTIRYQNRLLL